MFFVIIFELTLLKISEVCKTFLCEEPGQEETAKFMADHHVQVCSCKNTYLLSLKKNISRVFGLYITLFPLILYSIIKVSPAALQGFL